MKVKVKLSDIVEAFEMQDAMSFSYVNVRTGRVETISEEYLESTDHDRDSEDLPEWLRDEYARGREIFESSDYVDLLSQYEIHEYELMRSFAEEQSDSAVRKTLLGSLRGRGAFRRFKDAAFDSGVIEDWYIHRTNALAEIARDWCEENGFEVGEGDA